MPITEEHFETYDWKQIIAESDPAIRTEYNRLFGERAREARENGNQEAEELFSFLQSITFPYFKLDSDGNPLPGIEEVNEGYLEVLASVFSQIEDAEFRARVGDVLWLRRIGDKPHDYAFAAIDAYQEAAVDLEGFRNNKPTIERLTRALQLAHKLSQQDKIAGLESLIEDRIRSRAPSEDTWWTEGYARLLYDFELGDPAEQADLLETAVESLEDAADKASKEQTHESSKETDESKRSEEPYRCLIKDYWKLAAQWHFRSGNEDDGFRARMEAAETLVCIAANESHMALRRASLLEDAYEIYQDVPDARDRKDELYRKIRDAQQESLNELNRFSAPINDKEGWRDKSREAVNQSTLLDALVEFALLFPPDSLETLRDRTKTFASVGPLSFMLGGSQMDSSARITARKDTIEIGESDGVNEEAFEQRVFDTLRRYCSLQVANRIEPARRQIISDHGIEAEEIAELLSDNPIVPEDRIGSYAKALSSGFQGDFLSATHILAVQFEETVRRLLQQEGIITSDFDRKKKTQYERNLNNFLDPDHQLYRGAVVDLFGEDLVFHLRALLTSEQGANLRNKIAHSLAPDNEYFQPPSIYFWWLVWHLIVYGSPQLGEWIDDPMDRDEANGAD